MHTCLLPGGLLLRATQPCSLAISDLRADCGLQRPSQPTLDALLRSREPQLQPSNALLHLTSQVGQGGGRAFQQALRGRGVGSRGPGYCCC